MTSSVAALELIDRGDWRLVITDWMMPELDGPELCRRIRAVKRHPYTYIIMVTSRTDRLDRLCIDRRHGWRAFGDMGNTFSLW